jgi:hypothetical protein
MKKLSPVKACLKSCRGTAAFVIASMLLMNNKQRHRALTSCFGGCVFVLVAIDSPLTQAAILWTGPNISFTESANSRSDVILAGKVVLTRAGTNVLYNTAAGETSAGASSPADTGWTFGVISNFSTLRFQSLESIRTHGSGDLAALLLNRQMVMHLINEDIYLSVKFTAWGQHDSGGFAYVRSTPALAVLPTVSITSPSAGAVFAAPANVKILAGATASGGIVTNVSLFNDTTLLGSAQSPPFSITASNLAAGAYSLTAVAAASGVSSTSSVVNITVIAPVAVSLTLPAVSNGLFSFWYSANPGLSYVVQSTSNLVDWVPAVTNVASSSPVLFMEGLRANAWRSYRVGRLPNP